MIKNITKDSVSQQCSECGIINVISIDTLAVGTDSDENIIILPRCSCGAREFLNRTFDNKGEHARIVNSLHGHLYRKGKVKGIVKEKLDKEKKKPKNSIDIGKLEGVLENNGGFVDDSK